MGNSEILAIVGKVERFCKFFKVRVPSEFKAWLMNYGKKVFANA